MGKISKAFSIAIIATATLECSTINAQTVITFNKNGVSTSTKGASKKNIKTKKQFQFFTLDFYNRTCYYTGVNSVK